MTNLWLYLCVVSFLWTYVPSTDGKIITKLPPYIHACKRSDPKLDECFKKFFESIESKFSSGIPELDMPSMEPLKTEKFVFKLPGNGKNKMECTNVVVRGLSKLKVHNISIDPENFKMKIKASLPFVTAEGLYEIDAHLMNMVLKGKGPFSGNASDITIQSTADGKLIEKDGQKVLHVEHAEASDVSWKKHHLKIENLFPDKKANDGFNNMINGPAGQTMVKSQMPLLKSVIISTMMEYLNDVIERFPYNLIFQP